MKNKKGFTLIEIIICIGLILLIGTSSIIGFKIISNKKLITKLEQISEKASEAAQVYIETNDTATNQLYNNKNGVSLPLQLLVNEGLLSLEGTELTEEDIKDQYVVTFLGGTGSSENCEQITSTNSWSNNQPIYLCLNSNGSSNLETKYANKTYLIGNNIYYFTGETPENYVNIKEDEIYIDIYSNSKFVETVDLSTMNSQYNDYRIYAIDREDNILLAVPLDSKYWYSRYNFKYKCDGKYNTYSYNSISLENLIKTGYTGEIYVSTWLGSIDSDNKVYPTNANYSFILKLSSECKITGGTGMKDNKFEITCN